MHFPYSKSAPDQPEKTACSQEKLDFQDRLTAFYTGTPMPTGKELDAGPTDDEVLAHQEAELLAQLDGLDTFENEVQARFVPLFDPDELEAVSKSIEKIYPEPTSRYDKAFAEVVRCERRLGDIDQEHPDYHKVMADLASAKAVRKEELRRGLDDTWRNRHEVDQWRSGEGREEYNASRRKVRDKANADLSGMTEEERDQHRRDQKRDSDIRCSLRAKGKSDAAIEMHLSKARKKRAAKRAAK